MPLDRRQSISQTRRRVLMAAGALGALGGCARLTPVRSTGLALDPFTLGVASGDPQAGGFVIWTRLAPEPLADESGAGGMPPERVEVEWLIAEDEQLRRVAQRGTLFAEPDWAHSVHVEVAGLNPDRPYWYCFRAGDWQSRTGRTRTAPAAWAPAGTLRFAFASCQHYETGRYDAYRHLLAGEPELIVHLGDYIYETSAKREHVLRKHGTPDPRSLPEYRRRYANYKLDPDLRDAHAHCPWLLTWDDHEVRNDYAGLHSPDPESSEKFRLRRAAAYQAYWEHQPLRLRARPQNGDSQLYTACTFGTLLRVHVLDTRQYRDDQACATRTKRGGQQLEEDCAQRLDPARSLLGATQEAWLADQLSQSQARWNVLAQAVMMAPLDQKPGAGVSHWSDAWDGYPAARSRLLRALSARRVLNPVVLSGDIHSFWANDLHAEGADSPVVASEFVGTSLSSPGLDHAAVSALLPENPQVKFFDAQFRGYAACELTPTQWHTDFRAVDDVRISGGTAHSLARFVVESDRPGVQRIA